ncbi:SHOCT domain-containing protein [Spirosoma agri]|uniref:SHOCT domain-containing protein n=1 Tax=Spirosoma agri TaxID=1987381 RepID=A0A6M0IJ24_9BACT|nr:SHOCT domain-containing protein [Spirosoma agri]NEU68258.1 SHOCT domain-containing protein [Spirosoma agri]
MNQDSLRNLELLHKLKQEGAITEDEFNKHKASLLAEKEPVSTKADPSVEPKFDQSYQALRTETSYIFSSFRALILAQITIIGFIAQNIVPNSADIGKVSIYGILMSVIILISTFFGNSWFYQAVHQITYLFFAYELPLLKRLKQAKSINDSDYAPLWILANRSKGKVDHLHITVRKYFAGFEFKTFCTLQLVLALCCIAVTNVFLWLGWGTDNNTVKIEYRIICFLSEGSMLITLAFTIYFFFRCNTIFHDNNESWKKYMDNRNSYDTNYINDNSLQKYI